jgi:hypothetical protein
MVYASDLVESWEEFLSVFCGKSFCHTTFPLRLVPDRSKRSIDYLTLWTAVVARVVAEAASITSSDRQREGWPAAMRGQALSVCFVPPPIGH